MLVYAVGRLQIKHEPENGAFYKPEKLLGLHGRPEKLSDQQVNTQDDLIINPYLD